MTLIDDVTNSLVLPRLYCQIVIHQHPTPLEDWRRKVKRRNVTCGFNLLSWLPQIYIVSETTIELGMTSYNTYNGTVTNITMFIKYTGEIAIIMQLLLLHRLQSIRHFPGWVTFSLVNVRLKIKFGG